MTCSLVFHFKVKREVLQIHFLGDSFLALLTVNSVLLFSFQENSFVDELKLWTDEKTVKYIKDFCLTDMDLIERVNPETKEREYLISVGTESGKVIIWRVQEKRTEVEVEVEGKMEKRTNVVAESEYQVFGIYQGTRVKRARFAEVDLAEKSSELNTEDDQSELTEKISTVNEASKKLMFVTVSTNGDLSVFDLSFAWEKKFSSDENDISPLASLVDKKMEVRITQLDVCVIQEQSRNSKNENPKVVDTKTEVKSRRPKQIKQKEKSQRPKLVEQEEKSQKVNLVKQKAKKIKTKQITKKVAKRGKGKVKRKIKVVLKSKN